MKRVAAVLVSLFLFAVAWPRAQTRTPARVVFVGNSFTYGAGSPVRYYRADTVTDLNDEHNGGMPALFKSFVAQAGLDYEVALETRGGSGLEFHLENKQAVLGGRPWDVAVMHGQSTLDFDKPGDGAKLVRTAHDLAAFFRAHNPRVAIHLMATWSRADQTYPPQGTWAGQPIGAMARDVRAAYDRAMAATPGIASVIPVGEAWTRAIETGVADPNPYDGIGPGLLDLWTYDHYHASTSGYYLEALVVFGRLTGRDPRSLGDTECSAFELGLSRPQARALQQVAFDELASAGPMTPGPRSATPAAAPQRCGAPN